MNGNVASAHYGIPSTQRNVMRVSPNALSPAGLAYLAENQGCLMTFGLVVLAAL